MIPSCPFCHSKVKVVPITYGKPAQSLIQEAEQNRIYLGGCEPREENWYCYNCRRQFINYQK